MKGENKQSYRLLIRHLEKKKNSHLMLLQKISKLTIPCVEFKDADAILNILWNGQEEKFPETCITCSLIFFTQNFICSPKVVYTK